MTEGNDDPGHSSKLNSRPSNGKGLSGSLAKAGSWSIGGKLAAKLIDFATLLVLTNLLKPADFGLVAQAMAVIVVIEAITELPLFQPILRVRDPDRSVYDTAFTLSLARAVLIALMVACLTIPVAEYFREPRLGQLLWVLALAPILRGCISPRMTDFLRLYNLRPDAIITVISKASSFILVAIVAYATRSYWSIAIGTIVTPFLLMLLSYIYAPYRPRIDFQHWHTFSDVVGWSTVTQLSRSLIWQIDQFLLGRLLSVDIFGRYSVSRTISEMPLQALTQPLMTSMMPAFAQAEHQDRLRELWLRFSNTTLFVVGPIFVGVSSFASSFIYFLLGPEWSAAGPFVSGLMIAALPTLPGLPLDHLATSMFRTRLVAQRVVIQLIISVPVMVGLISWLGAIGAIFAKLIVASCMAIYTMVLVRKLLGISLAQQAENLIRSAVGLVAMTTAMWAFHSAFGSLQELNRLETGIFAGVGFAIGYAVYLIVTLGWWTACGRPPSAEALVVRLVRGFLAQGEAPDRTKLIN